MIPKNSAAIARPQPMQLQGQENVRAEAVMAQKTTRSLFSLRFTRERSPSSLEQSVLCAAPANHHVVTPRNRFFFLSPFAWSGHASLALAARTFASYESSRLRQRKASPFLIHPTQPPPRPGLGATPAANESHTFRSTTTIPTGRQTTPASQHHSQGCTRRTHSPPLLHPEPLLVAAPGSKPAPGDVLDPRAEDEVAPPPLPAGPVARGQRVVEHVRHARSYAGFPHSLRPGRSVVTGVHRGA